MIYDVSEVCDPCYYNIHVFVDDYCRSLYADIVNVQGGKIVWSFIKPLIMGKILYTPPNPAVNRIMEKVCLYKSPCCIAHTRFLLMFSIRQSYFCS